MKRLLFILCILLYTSATLLANDKIRGRILDQNNQPVDAVAVILQTADSTFIDAVISDPDGYFEFTQDVTDTRLFFQHILYEPFELELSTEDAGIINLKEKDILLDEITVVVERPTVRVSGGTLVYNTPQLISNKPVTTAYEAVKEIPGITGEDDEMSLLGARSLHIILNGQLTTMSKEQVVEMLKTIPASRVKSTEVMYNAPARYNVKGAVLNIVLDGGTDDTVQGEVGAEFRQYHNAYGAAHGNILYKKRQFSMDLLANGKKRKGYGGEEMFARHELKDETVEINQINRMSGNGTGATFRLGMDYTFANEDQLTGSYFFDGSWSDSERTANSIFNYVDRNMIIPVNSINENDMTSCLQNAQIQYNGHQRITAGIDYTHFFAPDDQLFKNYEDGVLTTDLLNKTKQNIHKGMAFINHTSVAGDDWTLNYGVNGSFTRSKTNLEDRYNENGQYITDGQSLSRNKQTEYGGNGFIQVSHDFGKLSADVSLKLEYFRSDYDDGQEKTTLWDDWALFPNVSFSYTFQPIHILQLNVSSDKTYPSYWSVNPQMLYINSYSVTMGNPYLKPQRSYEGQLIYILKQKYMFLAFCDYEPDKFLQVPVQQADELLNVFRFENFKYRVSSGIGVILPFRLSTIVDSRLTINGVHMREKSHKDYAVPFDNTQLFAVVNLSNTINISESRPNLKWTISGYYISPAQQGMYKLGTMYDVSTGLKWTFTNDRAVLTLKCNNIFASTSPSYMRINTGNQYSNMSLIDNTRFVGVSFAWKFGGYKEKTHSTVDSSRFGR